MKPSQTKRNVSIEGLETHLNIDNDSYVLVFDISSLKLKAISNNSHIYFQEPLEIGQGFTSIFLLDQNILEKENYFIITTLTNHKNESFDAFITKDEHNLFVIICNSEHQFSTNELINTQLQVQRSISSEKEIEGICDKWLFEIRKLVNAQLISIYQFDNQLNWKILASNNLDGNPAYDLMYFPASDWPTFLFEMLQKGIPYLGSKLEGEPTLLNNSDTSLNLSSLPVVSCGKYTQQLWQNMGIGSILLFPIKLHEKLWGVLSISNPNELKLTIPLIGLLSQLTYTFAQNAQQLKTNNIKPRKSNILYSLLARISKYKLAEKAIEKTYNELQELLGASGISLFLNDNVYNFSSTPPNFIVQEIQEYLLDEVSSPIYYTNDPSQNIVSLQSFKSETKGFLAVKLSKNSKDFLVWYRPNQTKVIQWAGNPNANRETEDARKTFDPWTEVKKIGSLEWTNQDLFFAREISHHLINLIEQQEKEERQKEKTFELMFKTSSEFVSLLKEDFSLKYTNDITKETFNLDLEKGTLDWRRLVHPEDRTKLINYFLSVRAGETLTKEIEYRIKGKDNKYIYLETFASNHLNDSIFDGILCITRDVTSKVNALKRLDKFQIIIEKTNSAVLIVDKNRTASPITYANKGVAHFTENRARQAVIGRSWNLLSQYIENTVNASKFRKAFKQGSPIETTLKMKTEGENTIWVKAQISPLEEGNNVDKLVIILSDISEEIEAKEKLKDYSDRLHLSNEELQTFAYVASHDLQEPLRTISGFSELFSELYQEKIDQEGKEYLTFILQATGRMKKLINDLLHFSRLTTEKGFIKEVNVTDILEKAIDNLHTLIEENKAIITHDLLPKIFVNETLLLQVFQNLISNAIKYRKEEQPIVHISAKYEKKRWTFGVHDNGIGISEKYFERIFVIFQRLHTSDKYSGTGIGLAICKKIIEKYGGKIWVSSKEDQGSEFYFTIPEVLTLT